MKIYRDLVYRQTPQRELRLDLRVPDIQKPPVVMYIPMGGMRNCEKENAPFWLPEKGFAFASIECRVSSEAIAPAQIHDCQYAVRWLRTHAAEYGFNGASLGIWGNSAGGMLAALLATAGDTAVLREDDIPFSDVSCTVHAAVDGCGAPHDITYFARPEVSQRFPGVAENLAYYLGGAVETRLELARLVSPSTYISHDCSPLLIIQGEKDAAVPPEETIAFHQELRAAGSDAKLILLPEAEHGWDEALTSVQIVEFFTRTLATKA